MSLFSGLTAPSKLGGIFGLSCYMLLQGKLKDKIAQSGSANNTTKIFMGHGDADQVVRYDWGKATADKLKEWGHEVDFRTYRYTDLFLFRTTTVIASYHCSSPDATKKILALVTLNAISISGRRS